MWIEIILIAILGAVLVKFSRSATWLGAFAASIPIALIIALLRYKFNLFSISYSGRKDPDVIILDDALIVNGHCNRLDGENLWMIKAALKRDRCAGNHLFLEHQGRKRIRRDQGAGT